MEKIGRLNRIFIAALVMAIAFGAALTASTHAGAQANADTGNRKPDPAHPVVSAIKASSIVLATTPDTTAEVRIDASTLVVKDGRFASISALKVGDRVQVNPSVALPNGLEKKAASSANAPSATQPAPQNPTGDPDKNNPEQNRSPDPGPVGGENPSNSVGTSPPAQNPTGDPDKSAIEPAGSMPATTDAGSPVSAASGTTASLLWVSTTDDVLLSGVVRWVGGDTVIVHTPGVAYSEYAIHTTGATGYQRLTSPGASPTAGSSADVKVGTTLLILGQDGPVNNRGFFTTKAILLLPTSDKTR
jgi:hypothetical protein